MGKESGNIKAENILRASEGFYQLAKYAIDKLEVANERWYEYLPVAAVNTSFCIELLLKAILVLKNKILHIHDLKKLFENLAKEDRVEIDRRLRIIRNSKDAYNGRGFTYMTFYKNQSLIINLSDTQENLTQLFEIHRETFVKFRYIFEQDDTLVKYHFEGEVLLDLIEVLRTYAKERCSLTKEIPD